MERDRGEQDFQYCSISHLIGYYELCQRPECFGSNGGDFGDGSFGITLDRNALDVLGLVDESGELVEDGLQAHMVAYSDGRLTVDFPLPKELEDSGPDIPRLRNQRS